MWPRPWGGSWITSWGALVTLGLIAGWWLARRSARRMGVDPSHVDLLSPVMAASGLGGAVILGMLAQMMGVDVAAGVSAHGGRVLYGAMLMAVGVGILYAELAGIGLGRLGDLYAVSMAAAVALGRVGCYLAGCCWGKECGEEFALGVHFPPGSFAHAQEVNRGLAAVEGRSLAVYPVQLYEAGAMALLAAALWLWMPRRKVWGEGFLAFGVGYGVIRFVLEFWRGDNPVAWHGMTTSQLICVAVVVICAAVSVVRRKFAGRLRIRMGGEAAAR